MDGPEPRALYNGTPTLYKKAPFSTWNSNPATPRQDQLPSLYNQYTWSNSIKMLKVYTSDHSTSVHFCTANPQLALSNSALYLFPNIQPDLQTLDVGCSPGSMETQAVRRLWTRSPESLGSKLIFRNSRIEATWATSLLGIPKARWTMDDKSPLYLGKPTSYLFRFTLLSMLIHLRKLIATCS